MFSEQDIKEAGQFPSLGPAYFDARRVAQSVMERFEAEHFKPIVEALTRKVGEDLWTMLENFIVSDTESNVQGHIYRMVDNCVSALLSGDQWALDRYCLGTNHDHVKIRAAIAALIPAEIQEKRIIDLEVENKRLKEDLGFYRRSNVGGAF